MIARDPFAEAPSPSDLAPGVPADAPVAFTIGGRIQVRNRVLAAPICGASKLPFRRLARRWGADIAYTEMVKAYPLVRDDPKTLELLHTTADEAPCGPQICGGDPDTMERAAARLEALGFPLVDINMGCPVRKVVNEGAGAALLRDPAKVEAVTRACARAVSIPVTVKLRSGWDDDGHVDAATLARAAEAGGAALVAIHGRTRAQAHQGAVDFAAMARAKAAVSIPVVGNGGVFTAEAAVVMARETGCDAVMIGRGAFGRPWLFRDVARALAGLPALPPPDDEARCDVMRAHLDGMIALLGERGVLLYRKYAAWYFREAPWGAHFRDRAYRTREVATMTALLDAWRENLAVSRAALAAGAPPPFPALFADDPTLASADPWSGQACDLAAGLE